MTQTAPKPITPPPRHNFIELPRIRSERSAVELHHPHLVHQYRDESHIAGRGAPIRAMRSGRREPNPVKPIDKCTAGGKGEDRE